MTSISLILGISALAVSIAGLVVGCIALSAVIGLKNSTHQVTWKEIEPAKEADDPFQVEEEPIAEMNPNKRIKTEEEDLVDLDDPAITSGF